MKARKIMRNLQTRRKSRFLGFFVYVMTLKVMLQDRKSRLPRSGWDSFRDEKYSEVVEKGFSGKEIASQLGLMWKKVTPAEKNKYTLKAKFLKALGSEEEVLERTSTVCKSRKVEAVDPSLKIRRKRV